jgi:hypothetical protein
MGDDDADVGAGPMLLDLPQSVMTMYARRLSCCLAIILEEHGANKRTALC